MRLTIDRERMLAAMDAVVERTMNMDMTWDWPCGVAFYGIGEAYEVTRKAAYLDALAKWVDAYLEIGIPPHTVNGCAMGHALLLLFEETGEARYRDALMGMIEYLRHQAPRFAEGVLQHTVSVNNDFPEQAWADTLFMAAFLMLRVGIREGDGALIDDALSQYAGHIRYLQDPATGLWYHGYSHVRRDHMSGFFWGRANAWAAYTMSQVKRRLPQAYLYPDYMDVDCSLRDQLAGLRRLQTEAGLWRTLLDDPESYEEVSASAGIAAGMIENGNPLHAAQAMRAIEGVMANITEDGRVQNVSGGTAIMNDREGYVRISRTWTQGWGQGLALAMMAAALRRAE